MLTFILAILLAGATLLFISLLKIYTHVPKIELKRQARSGDESANMLYRAAAYGDSASVLLWFFIGLAAAIFFVLVATALPAWLALVVSLILIWAGFGWLPNTGSGVVGRTAARYFTPIFTGLLGVLYPVLDRIANWFKKYGHVTIHTGLYQKEDVLDLLNRQHAQTDNRITESELNVIAGALTYGDKLVGQIMIPWRVVKSVATTEAVGPHLMDELHASGHSRFPVYQDKPDNVVGMLYARDLINAQAGGQVRDLMKKEVFYIHEERRLNQALQAFLKTRHHLFIVVNSFEEKIGIITLEDVLEQIIGKQVVDEFDKYDDLRAVAAMTAKKEHSENQEPKDKE